MQRPSLVILARVTIISMCLFAPFCRAGSSTRVITPEKEIELIDHKLKWILNRDDPEQKEEILRLQQRREYLQRYISSDEYAQHKAMEEEMEKRRGFKGWLRRLPYIAVIVLCATWSRRRYERAMAEAEKEPNPVLREKRTNSIFLDYILYPVLFLLVAGGVIFLVGQML